ncbi:methyltransferase [Hymenobacter saemangeumensis]|uniref:tRNA1(Val) (adenine(37)-N6)-methyltransferase n=1 Tax=Hymenobacter saemangeumensis TaxID=1084522 RepID=A0ABP8I2W0_9BACT
MANDYFQFQQFRIEQRHCAMKVSTDACLLGAAADLHGATRLLDIGTGTGLLALMAAQRHSSVQIEAIEIDEAAARQAAANVAASPWASRIWVRGLSLSAYAVQQPVPFSHIICNPPFFRHSLLSPDAARSTARHAGEASLSFAELAGFAAAYLLPAGSLTVLLPPTEMQGFASEAQAAGLHLQGELRVRHRPGGRITRHISRFGLTLSEPSRQELAIQTAGGEYSAAFQELLGGFYLAL